MWVQPEEPRVNVPDQIAALQIATVPELAARYVDAFGHPPRSRNAAWLRKRLVHQLQVAAYGGLPRVAREALDKLMAEITIPNAAAATPPAPADAAPRPNSVLMREWRGQQVRVLVADDGQFEWDGRRFGSLSAVAFAITGARWNGKLFFGLVERKRA